MLRNLTLLIALLLAGCNKAQTVSREDLQRLRSEWREPKVSMWYYMGSSEGHHYFRHKDLGGDAVYRISDKEFDWPGSFPLTADRKLWRKLKWGVHELQ